MTPALKIEIRDERPPVSAEALAAAEQRLAESDPPSEDDLFWVAPDLETFLGGLSEDDDEPAPPEARRGLGRLFGRS